MGHSARWEISDQRIAALEEALADYVLRYGLTEKARLALAAGENPFADLVAVLGREPEAEARSSLAH